jgi:hypothetical protein
LLFECCTPSAGDIGLGEVRRLVIRLKSCPFRGIGPIKNDATGDCFDGTLSLLSLDRKPLFDEDDRPGERRDMAQLKREGTIISMHGTNKKTVMANLLQL